MNRVEFPQSYCQAGAARRDITPPLGIYHRMWGAAKHDRSTGIHRRLTATALVVAPREGLGQQQAIVAIDHCLLWADDGLWLRNAVAEQAGLSSEDVQICFSHTHAAGLLGRERAQLPGGELIEPYFRDLARLIADAVKEAASKLRPSSIVYGLGRCDLAKNRDFWDDARGSYVCGFNPRSPADDTLLVGRILNDENETVAILVNYACHPTTLAWQNTEISPDYIGAMQEVIENVLNAPSLFFQGASGELAPREGYVVDFATADRHGRKLGYAVLATVEGLPPPECTFEYQGAVVSGAVLGTWAYVEPEGPLDSQRTAWQVESFPVELAYRKGLATLAETNAEIARLNGSEQTGETRALLEQLNRQRTRLALLPPGAKYPFPVTMMQIGEAIWLFLESEHYSYLQMELRQRWPQVPLVVTTVVNFWRAGYLPNKGTYGLGIYPELIAMLAPGSLEHLVDGISDKIRSWLVK